MFPRPVYFFFPSLYEVSTVLYSSVYSDNNIITTPCLLQSHDTWCWKSKIHGIHVGANCFLLLPLQSKPLSLCRPYPIEMTGGSELCMVLRKGMKGNRPFGKKNKKWYAFLPSLRWEDWCLCFWYGPGSRCKKPEPCAHSLYLATCSAVVNAKQK